ATVARTARTQAAALPPRPSLGGGGWPSFTGSVRSSRKTARNPWGAPPSAAEKRAASSTAVSEKRSSSGTPPSQAIDPRGAAAGSAEKDFAHAVDRAQRRRNRSGLRLGAERDHVGACVDGGPSRNALVAQGLHAAQAGHRRGLPIEERRIGRQRVGVHAQRVP